MKLFHLISAASLLLCTTISCKKDPIETISNEPKGKISFAYPKIGQQTKFVLFRGEDIKDNANFSFEYLQDTLVLTIVGQDDNGFVIQEKLTDGSISLHGQNNVGYADETTEYYMYYEDSEVKFKRKGERYFNRVFFVAERAAKGLSLLPIMMPELQTKGWKTTMPFDKQYHDAMVKEHEQQDKIYEDLNVVIDNRPMQDNLPGFTHIYNDVDGLVRSFEYSDYDGKGYGWEVL